MANLVNSEGSRNQNQMQVNKADSFKGHYGEDIKVEKENNILNVTYTDIDTNEQKSFKIHLTNGSFGKNQNAIVQNAVLAYQVGLLASKTKTGGKLLFKITDHNVVLVRQKDSVLAKLLRGLHIYNMTSYSCTLEIGNEKTQNLRATLLTQSKVFLKNERHNYIINNENLTNPTEKELDEKWSKLPPNKKESALDEMWDKLSSGEQNELIEDTIDDISTWNILPPKVHLTYSNLKKQFHEKDPHEYRELIWKELPPSKQNWLMIAATRDEKLFLALPPSVWSKLLNKAKGNDLNTLINAFMGKATSELDPNTRWQGFSLEKQEALIGIATDNMNVRKTLPESVLVEVFNKAPLDKRNLIWGNLTTDQKSKLIEEAKKDNTKLQGLPDFAVRKLLQDINSDDERQGIWEKLSESQKKSLCKLAETDTGTLIAMPNKVVQDLASEKPDIIIKNLDVAPTESDNRAIWEKLTGEQQDDLRTKALTDEKTLQALPKEEATTVLVNAGNKKECWQKLSYEQRKYILEEWKPSSEHNEMDSFYEKILHDAPDDPTLFHSLLVKDALDMVKHLNKDQALGILKATDSEAMRMAIWLKLPDGVQLKIREEAKNNNDTLRGLPKDVAQSLQKSKETIVADEEPTTSAAQAKEAKEAAANMKKINAADSIKAKQKVWKGFLPEQRNQICLAAKEGDYETLKPIAKEVIDYLLTKDAKIFSNRQLVDFLADAIEPTATSVNNPDLASAATGAIGATYEYATVMNNCDWVTADRNRGRAGGFDGAGHGNASLVTVEHPYYETTMKLFDMEVRIFLKENPNPNLEKVTKFKEHLEKRFITYNNDLFDKLMRVESKEGNDAFSALQTELKSVFETGNITEEIVEKLVSSLSEEGLVAEKKKIENRLQEDKQTYSVYFELLDLIKERKVDKLTVKLQGLANEFQVMNLEFSKMKTKSNKDELEEEIIVHPYNATKQLATDYKVLNVDKYRSRAGPGMVLAQFLPGPDSDGKKHLLTLQYADYCFAVVEPGENSEPKLTEKTGKFQDTGFAGSGDNTPPVMSVPQLVDPGTRVVAYSDGVGEFLTKEEIRQILMENPGADAERLKDLFIEKIKGELTGENRMQASNSAEKCKIWNKDDAQYFDDVSVFVLTA